MKKPSPSDKQPIGHRFSFTPPIILNLGEAAQPGRLFRGIPVSKNAALLEGMAALKKQIQDLAARSIHPQVLDSPTTPHQGAKPIPWNWSLGKLLNALRTCPQIREAEPGLIAGHFNVGTVSPTKKIEWEGTGLDLAAFFVGGAQEGAFPHGKEALGLPRGTPEWARDHFAIRVGSKNTARDPHCFRTQWRDLVKNQPEQARARATKFRGFFRLIAEKTEKLTETAT